MRVIPSGLRERSRGWIWPIGVAAAIILGAMLRLVWVMDIEYKWDEAWTFERTQQVGRTEPFPWGGMPSSVKVKNPGLSLWVFLFLAKLFAAHDPIALARGVQILNVCALGLLVCFASIVIAKEEREPWLWATVLAAVNPLAVLFHRKIWPPSVLPIFSILTLGGWWFRHRPSGAFTWGLIGAWLGQIHASGFFFAAGLVVWAWLFDRRRVAWLSWFGGSCLGVLPLIPWFQHVFTESGDRQISTRWSRLFEFKFWTHWATEPLGVGLKYSLGEDFREFLNYPIFNGRPTYLVGLLHLLIMAVGLVILVRAGSRHWQDRRRWREVLIGRDSQTTFTLSAAFLGFGILFTASRLPFYRHYLIVTFPLMYLWLASLAIPQSPHSARSLRFGRGLLVALCILQFLLSLSFLGYIHENQGANHGDYGITYGAQRQGQSGPRRLP